MTRVPFTYTWIEPGKILIGSIPQLPEDLAVLVGLGVMTIVSLTRRDVRTYPDMNWRGHYGHFPIVDGSIASDDIMLGAVDYIAQSIDEQRIPLYVHCRGGIGRSGIILQAYYVLYRGKTIEEARGILRVRRNYEGNATAADQGSPQREWLEMVTVKQS